jgi:hypothetical protein
MKTHGTIGGSAWIPSLIAIVVLALFVLVVFGATPSDLLEIPQITFNNLKPASAPKPSESPVPLETPAPSATPALNATKAPTVTPVPVPTTAPLGTPALPDSGLDMHGKH